MGSRQRYWDRHATKPGLTGLAQVRGFRGATLVEDDLRNRLQADLEYLENWSIWRDIKIIFLTVRVISTATPFDASPCRRVRRDEGKVHGTFVKGGYAALVTSPDTGGTRQEQAWLESRLDMRSAR